jgi:hypothetical protein
MLEIAEMIEYYGRRHFPTELRILVGKTLRRQVCEAFERYFWILVSSVSSRGILRSIQERQRWCDFQGEGWSMCVCPVRGGGPLLENCSIMILFENGTCILATLACTRFADG